MWRRVTARHASSNRRQRDPMCARLLVWRQVLLLLLHTTTTTTTSAASDTNVDNSSLTLCTRQQRCRSPARCCHTVKGALGAHYPIVTTTTTTRSCSSSGSGSGTLSLSSYCCSDSCCADSCLHRGESQRVRNLFKNWRLCLLLLLLLPQFRQLLPPLHHISHGQWLLWLLWRLTRLLLSLRLWLRLRVIWL